MTYSSRSLAIPATLALIFHAGCEVHHVQMAEKSPRPVIAIRLSKTLPPSAALVTGSVGAWKSERVGFEVSGRVESVVEQNTEIQARVVDADGSVLAPGTPIAKLERERFELQVVRAIAEVTRAEQTLISAETDLRESIPAQLASAIASRRLAETDYARSGKLKSQNAISDAEVDANKAAVDRAVAQVQQFEAAAKSKAAEIDSLKSAVLQAKQSLRDAERDVEDCTLYASFNGQIAATSVVPGSIVKAGEAVATLQMMDPIKVELEVSAEQSKQLQRTEIRPVHVAMPDGSNHICEGFLYQVDSIADPSTRTYTLTFLILNERIRNEIEGDVATTPDAWRLDLHFLAGSGAGKFFIEEKAILEDDQGHFIWKIIDPSPHGDMMDNRTYEVQKFRVTPGPTRAPFLGNWVFQEITIDEPEFNPETDRFMGELSVQDGDVNDWNGTRVRIDSGPRWMLRPGDLAKVDLSRSPSTSGYYVQRDAIVRRNDRSFIFVVDASGDESIVQRIEVVLVEQSPSAPSSSICQIEASDGSSLEGRRCVLRGAHYLVEGERVVEVSASEKDE